MITTLRNIILLLFLSFSFLGFNQSIDQIQIQRADSLQHLLDKAKIDTSKVMIASELSRILQTIDQKTKGLKLAKEANDLAKKIQFKRGLASTYASLGNAYRELGRMHEASEALFRSMEWCKKSNYRKEEGFVYHNLGQVYWANGDTLNAIKSHEKALKINQELNILNRQGFAHDFLGFIYVQKGDNKQALTHYHASLKVFTELKIVHRIALSAGNVGMINLWLGNSNEALKYFILAAKNYELENNTKGILWIYGLISNVYRGIYDYENAMKYNDLLLNLYIKVDSTRGVADAYQLIGETYLQQEELSLAEEHLKKALNIYNKVDYPTGKFNTLISIAEWHFKKKEYSKALDQIEVVIEEAKKGLSKNTLADAQKWKGLILVHLNQPHEATKMLKQALAHYKNVGAKQQYSTLYEYLAKADSAVGDFQSAYLHYKQFIESKSAELATLSDTEKLALKYEFEKREAVANAELRAKRVQRNMAIFGLVLAVIILILIIYFFRLRKANLDVEKENIELQKREFDRIRETEAFKSRFLTNISHEFRTPLTLIRGHLELMEQTVAEGDRRRILEMQNNSEHLLQLINQLLDLAKLESGQYRLYFEKKNVLLELRAFISSFHSYALQQGVDIEVEIGVKVERYLDQHAFGFSSDALHIIVNNLLSNAIKFTPSGGKVTCRVACKAGVLSIEVEDNGIGISEANLPKVFDRFFQVDDPDRPTYAGSGIGLALVKELANLHGGDVTVTSEIGKGTCFTVTLKDSSPSEMTQLDNAQAVNPRVTREEEQEVELNEAEELPVLLIVEDQDDLHQFIASNLFEFGQIIQAKNGKEGLAKAMERVPDLIISDVMMPEMDGLTMCRTLKEQTETSHIPVLLLTAKADEQDRLVGLQDGADDYLAKPFSVKELQLRVRNRLRLQVKYAQQFSKKDLIKTKEVESEATNRTLSGGWKIKEIEWMDKLKNVVLKNIDNPQFGVGNLADASCLSTSQLNRKLKALTGFSSSDLIRQVRLERAVVLLKEGIPVAEVAWKVGFEDPIYFSKVFKKYFSFPPSSLSKEEIV